MDGSEHGKATEWRGKDGNAGGGGGARGRGSNEQGGGQRENKLRRGLKWGRSLTNHLQDGHRTPVCGGPNLRRSSRVTACR